MKKRIAVVISAVLVAILFSIPVFAMPSNIAYSSTKAFLEALEQEGIKYTYEGVNNEKENVRISYNLDDTKINVTVYFDEDLKSCAFRVWNYIDYDASNQSWVMQTLDKLNSKYRWAKFYTDSTDDSVTVAMDVIFRNNDIGPICREALEHVVDICDDAYPSLKNYDKNAQ